MTASQSSLVGDREIVIDRVVDAPRELVWEAWTQIEHIERWWGPNGFTTTTREFDIRPGGAWRFIMHGPDGVDYNNRIIFREITPPERLVYYHDDDGEGALGNFTGIVTFEELGNRSRVTLHSEFASKAERDRHVEEYGAIEGGKQTLARMAEYVTSREIRA
jgi:uncharacterized protein YndB with AHSA1/START domain